MSRRILLIQNPQPVIVRAFGDEPVHMYAIGYGRGFIEVSRGSVGGTKSIGLPPDHVFEFDEEAFALLLRAYKHNRRSELRARWQTLAPYTSPELAARKVA